MQRSGYQLRVSPDVIRVSYKPTLRDRFVTLGIGVLFASQLLGNVSGVSLLFALIILCIAVASPFLIHGQLLVVTPTGIDYVHRKWTRWERRDICRDEVHDLSRAAVVSQNSSRVYVRIKTDAGDLDVLEDAQRASRLICCLRVARWATR